MTLLGILVKNTMKNVYEKITVIL